MSLKSINPANGQEIAAYEEMSTDEEVDESKDEEIEEAKDEDEDQDDKE